MAHTFYFGKVAKRKNSTLQGAVSAPYDVLFKTPTSIDEPTITLHHSGDFDYNYAKYKDNYYFVADKVSRNNDLWEVTLELDPLATCKSEILNSTQFVSYSSASGGVWLPDTRIPVLNNALVSASSSAIGILDANGTYILSVVGKESAASYDLTLTNLRDVIASISDWETNGIADINAMISAASSNDNDAICKTLATIGEAMINTGFVGNAYAQAPACIRSCIWIPFGYVLHEGTDTIYLGNFNTNVMAKRVSAKPITNSTTVNIPWHFSDWRRASCENVYLYLPLVGMVSLSTNEIVNVSSLTIKWSATATDGCICYEVLAGSQVIGTYGGNASANYPIGVNQQSSAGEITQSYLNGISKTINVATSSSLSPISMGGAAAGVAFEAISAGYDAVNTQYSSHASCIGGVGGGAGSGLDLDAKCFTVAHPTVIEPAQMAATMGVPTMKPMTLSSLSGYCQCANAHVSAAVDAPILNKIDAYLNSGFYIE